MGEKVAVLGAGVAGLTAALELTATPELRERYDVTIYQLGWRCGGKCSTGRSVEIGARVEEHGLHLWFGGYDNAFSLLARCYEELGRPADHPIATMEQAWTPLSSVVLYDHYDGRWSRVLRTFDIEPGRPWDAIEVPRFWDMLVSVLHAVEGHLHWLRSPAHPARLPSARIGPVQRVVRTIGDVVERVMVRGAEEVVEWHRRHDVKSRRRVHVVSWLLGRLRARIWKRHVRDHIADDDVRHRFSQTDTMLSCMIGMIRDDVLWDGYDTINDLDFREWLARNGARPTTLDGPDVRVIYDESFADSIGPATTATGAERTQRGNAAFAAGAALYGIVRTRLPYRGSVMWQASGGMGDTAIAPMYETLMQRGVDVRFFQLVTEIGVDAGASVIDRIEIVQQARPRNDYEPLVDVKGLSCWPSHPSWDQLEDGEKLAEADVAFELGESEPGAATKTLRRGDDFDTVVLAISAAALPSICGQVMDASPAFKTMLDHTNTTMTQAFQLWLTTPPSELGWPFGHTATSSFVEPVDTACDNSQLLWSEDWPEGHEPRSVWYFCGVLADVDGPEDWPQADARARAAAYGYLDAIGHEWPGAVDGDGFRWDLLASPRDVSGPARFETQFWRANVALTERYVQTQPGTVRHRLGADESGLTNLFLAGDWVRNGMDIGAVEATVMSGMLASRAISGSPSEIAWERQAWMVDG